MNDTQSNVEKPQEAVDLPRIVRRVRELETALGQVKAILAVPASNHRMMQIAGPARQCLNIIKSTEAPNAPHQATASE